jgi:hypothetical protein
LNRVHGTPPRVPSTAELDELIAARSLGLTAPQLLRALADESARAQTEAPQIEKALRLFTAANVWRVPVMAGDVRGLGDLAKVAATLVHG